MRRMRSRVGGVVPVIHGAACSKGIKGRRNDPFVAVGTQGVSRATASEDQELFHTYRSVAVADGFGLVHKLALRKCTVKGVRRAGADLRS